MLTGRLKNLAIDYMNQNQVISIEINEDARTLFDLLRDDVVSVEIKKFRKKRSLDANAYFHVLVSKIADVLRISKPRCKNILIARYGQIETLEDSSPIVMKSNIPVEKMLEVEEMHWHPIGSKIEDGNELVFYRLYRGSHTYNTEEMSILIDGTVQEAKDLDIETMTPDEIKKMKEVYNEKIKKRVNG